MELVRNFINVAGLAGPDDLPRNFKGQIIQYSETETLFMPDNQPDMKSIFQVMIQIGKHNSRSITTENNTLAVIDGTKKLKIIYTQNDSSGKANFLDLELPYNTFMEVPGPIPMENVHIHVLDAYFNLLDSRRIYSYIVYAVYVSLDTGRDEKNMGASSKMPGMAENRVVEGLPQAPESQDGLDYEYFPYEALPGADKSGDASEAMEAQPDPAYLIEIDEEYL